MELQIHSTSKLVTFNGVPARVWEGTTASGIPVIAFVTRVAVEDHFKTEQFEAELLEQRPPSAAAESFPARMVI